MVDKVIVTLIYKDTQADMEFPAQISIKEIRPVLVRAMQKRGISIAEPYKLVHDGRTLSDSETFLEGGVWDGSYLELIC